MRATAACENQLNIYAFHSTSLLINTQPAEHMATTRLPLGCSRERKKNKTQDPRARHASGYIAYVCFQEGLLHFIFHRFFARSVASVSQGRPQTRDFIPDKCITSRRKEWTHCSLMRFKWAQVFWRESAYLSDGPLASTTWHRLGTRCDLHEAYGDVLVRTNNKSKAKLTLT